MVDNGDPVIFDDDNPEWTEEMFAKARPASEVLPPEVITAFGKGKRGRPIGSKKSDAKRSITLRLDPEVIDGWRSTGPGWQRRMNDALREALPR